MPKQNPTTLTPSNNEENINVDNRQIFVETKLREFNFDRLREQIYLDVICSWLLVIFIGCKEIEDRYGFKYSNNDFIAFHTIWICLLISVFSLWFSIKFEINRRKLLNDIDENQPNSENKDNEEQAALPKPIQIKKVKIKKPKIKRANQLIE